MIRCLAYAFNAIFKSRARLVAENNLVTNQVICQVTESDCVGSGVTIAQFTRIGLLRSTADPK